MTKKKGKSLRSKKLELDISIFESIEAMVKFRTDCDLFLGKENVRVAICMPDELSVGEPYKYRRQQFGIVMFTIHFKTSNDLLRIMIVLRTAYLKANNAFYSLRHPLLSPNVCRPYKERARYILAFKRVAKQVDFKLMQKFVMEG